MRGYVDGVLDGRVIGWCWRPEEPSARLTAEVYVDDVKVAEGTADRFREPLLRRGIGDGHHGFAIHLPRSLDDGRLHRVRVEAGGTRLPSVPNFLTGRRMPRTGGPWHATMFEPEPAPEPTRALARRTATGVAAAPVPAVAPAGSPAVAAQQGSNASWTRT